ncbi:MAG: methyltransferase domain-containing protein [Candidatus Neomarinimicrobiota bacterium]|nr:methyltransferase domain-containing protein [Candidatus Neomarinimicrobiota bacterium]|tara:strand:- start:799 stop:1401 length:603 start_codon:yes stop_codon:yes gene_type:complete
MICSEEDIQFWEDIYISGDATWDLGGATPIFESISKDIRPGKICIIGCGKGHDAVMFAKKNFEVTAIDFAPSAISYLKQLAADVKVDIHAINTDIFNLSNDYYNQFNYVIEQTCFCAINPTMRSDYEQLVFNLLIKGGLLIGLWFPLDKNISEGGPPWATSVEEVKNLFSTRWEIEREEFSTLSIKPRKDREKLIVFRKV